MFKKINPMILGVIPAIIFGFSFMFTKVTLQYFDDVFHLLGMRFMIAVLGLTVMIVLKVVRVDLKGKNIKLLLWVSFTQPIAYFLFETYGIKNSSASQAGVMIAFIPVAVTLLAVLLLKERTNWKQISFIAISIIGVIIINADVKFSIDSLSGTLLLLGAVVSAAIYQVLSRKSSKQFTAIEITYVMMWVGAIVFNGVAIFNATKVNMLADYFQPLFKVEALGGLLYLGLLSSVFAFFIINYVLSHVVATKAAILANLTTVVAIVAGVVLLGENFNMIKVLGSMLILLGVYGTTKVKIDV